MLQKKNYKLAERLTKLPPYLFVEIDKMKQKAIDNGVDIINLGVGDPDIPTPLIIRESLKTNVEDVENHQYPLGKGKSLFRNEISKFMSSRFDVDVDPDKEVQQLLGSKEGIAHFPLAFVEQSDVVLIPEPAYPVYNAATLFAGGEPYFMPLSAENNYFPDFTKIPAEILNRAKMMFINYPNNPTGAMATEDNFKDAISIAQKYDIIICHDAAYTEMYFGTAPLSFLQVEGAKELGIEFHSLSKPFSMTGWRVGWACGNGELVEGLSKVKNNIDSGVFGAIQDSAIVALQNYKELRSSSNAVYADRANVFSAGLKQQGWKFNMPQATFYIWAKPPVKISSIDAVKVLLEEAGIVCTPGGGFGPSGEGYVRFALTKDVKRMEEALRRLSEVQWNKN